MGSFLAGNAASPTPAAAGRQWSSTAAVLNTPPPAATRGPDSFSYTVGDIYGGTDTRTVDVTVTSANAPSSNFVYGPAIVAGTFWFALRAPGDDLHSRNQRLIGRSRLG